MYCFKIYIDETKEKEICSPLKHLKALITRHFYVKTLCNNEDIFIFFSPMKFIAFFFYLTSLLFGYSQSLDSLIVELNKKEVIKGIAIGIYKDNETTYTSSGFAQTKNQIPFDSATQTRIASIIKPMTAIAIFQLFEKGKLKLDDPIGNYISEFSSGIKSTITIRQVLNHTSGIPSYLNKKEKENKKQYNSIEASFSIFKDRNLRSEPGSKFYYSSYGYVVLGVLIERITGLPYLQYMKKNIWEPAGMKNTQPEKRNKKELTLYKQNAKGKILEIKKSNLTDRIPGGGVTSTAEDLIAFGRAVLNHTLLKESTLQLMLQNPDIKTSGNIYAQGWTIYSSKAAKNLIIGHAGSQIGCSALLWIIPDKNQIVVSLTTISGMNSILNKIHQFILK